MKSFRILVVILLLFTFSSCTIVELATPKNKRVEAREKYYRNLVDSLEYNEWQLAKTLNASSSYQSYLKEYPSGKYSIEAKDKTDDLLWEETEKAGDRAHCRKYLRQFPEGKHAVEAKKMMDTFDKHK